MLIAFPTLCNSTSGLSISPSSKIYSLPVAFRSSGARKSIRCQASTESMGDAVVVGAGPAGCLMAHYLLRRGFKVQVFERYPPMAPTYSVDGPEQRIFPEGDYRSYPMVLTTRAITALEGAGLDLPSIFRKPLIGNTAYLPNGKKVQMKYSDNPNLQSYAISRNALVSFLQQSILERTGENLSVRFGVELVELSSDIRTAYFSKSKKHLTNEDEEEGENLKVHFDLLVGADGLSSKVRSEVMRLDQLENNTSSITLKLERDPASYKSFYINPSLAKSSPLFEDRDRVQAWPALNMLVVNVGDGSFWGGTQNDKLIKSKSPAEVEMLFRENAPKVFELVLKENPNFIEDFISQPAIPSGGSVMLSQFHKDRVVLIGDAAHAMVAAYGTGCNAALEDCFIFDKILAELTPENISEGTIPIPIATSEFTKRRLEDAHAIVEMNSNRMLFSRGTLSFLQAAFYKTLQKLFPKVVGPTAFQLLWSTVPFSKIKQKKQRENLIFYAVLVLLTAAVVLVSFSIIKRLFFVK